MTCTDYVPNKTKKNYFSCLLQKTDNITKRSAGTSESALLSLVSVVLLLLTDASTYRLLKVMGMLLRGYDLKLWGT
jgi:hypothetical protein